MRSLIFMAALVMLAGPAAGKSVAPEDVFPDLVTARQGGDTLADAAVVDGLPFTDTGTTEGYNQSYHGFCAYPESGMAADVCYIYTPAADDIISIDLLGSDYDTTLLTFRVLGADLEPLECNDDYHPDLTSRIDDLPVVVGDTYLIVVDGYGFETGNYVLTINGETVATEPASWSEIKSWYGR